MPLFCYYSRYFSIMVSTPVVAFSCIYTNRFAYEEAHFQTYFILLCFGDIAFFTNWRLVGTLH